MESKNLLKKERDNSRLILYRFSLLTGDETKLVQ